MFLDGIQREMVGRSYMFAIADDSGGQLMAGFIRVSFAVNFGWFVLDFDNG